MATRYALAEEFRRQPRITIPANGFVLRILNGLIRWQCRRFRWSDEVEVRIHSLERSDAPGTAIPVIEVAPKDLPDGAPAVIDYHGGGFFLSYASLHLRYAEHYARQARCRVFFPDYRLSADHPFPAGFDDCYATLAWVHRDAGELGVDAGRIALLGDSAGGALAAGVAQKALDEGSHPVCGQVLVYPVTDHRTTSDSARRFTDTPLWKTASNRNMWKVYLPDVDPARDPAPPYAAPLHRESFAGLPPAWVEVAEFDPLRDEGLQYAEALKQAGVPVETRERLGAIHGYDLVEGSPIAASALKERLEALRAFLE